MDALSYLARPLLAGVFLVAGISKLVSGVRGAGSESKTRSVTMTGARMTTNYRGDC
jgi:hypothetical protein